MVELGNLPYGVNSEDLTGVFGEFGQVSNANVITDKFSGKSKGFGFVEMANDEEAEAAINALNESELKGRNIKVNEARPREDRPDRQRRPRY